MAQAPTSPNAGPDREKLLIRLALRKQLVSREQVEYCLNIQKQLKARGQQASIPYIMHRSGILSKRQLEALIQVTDKAYRRATARGPEIKSKEPDLRGKLPHELERGDTRDRSEVMHSIRTQFSPDKVQLPPRKGQKSTPTSTNLNIHIPKHRLDRMRVELERDDFKQTLVDLLRDGALNGPPIDPNSETPVPFGPFKTLELLGQGGMAMVYKVYDEDTRQEVALKVMKPGIARKREYVLRFLREACNTALIRHPNTVNLFSLGAVDGRLYFTLELIEGTTLKQRMQEGPITPAFGLEVLRQVMEGMIAAHEQGVTHRDLKPSNIMLTTDEAQFGFGIKGDSNTVVKVMDFGLARQVDGEAVGKITQEGEFLGTAKYVAPELIRGEEPTLQSDIFALGIMAFQMFSGEPPFKVRSKVEYIEANLKWTAPLVSDVVKGLPRGITMLVDAMLDKDPVERPTADTILRDIERLERLEPGQGIPQDLQDEDSIFHPKVFNRRKKRRNRGGKSKKQVDWQKLVKDPKILGVAGGCVLFLLILWLVLKSSTPNIPEEPDNPPKIPKQDKPKPKTPDPIDRIISKLEGFEPIELPHESHFSYGKEKKTRFVNFMKSGDQAWLDKKWDEAVTNWRQANDMVKLPQLEARFRAVVVKKLEIEILGAKRANNWKRVVELLEQSLSELPNDKKLDRQLAEAKQYRSYQSEAQNLRDKFAMAIRESNTEDAQRLLSDLKRLMNDQGRPLIDPDNLYSKLEFDLNGLIRKLKKKQEALKYLEQCFEYVEQQKYDLAKVSLNNAKVQIGADSQEYLKHLKLVNALQSKPKGFIYLPPSEIEVFGTQKEVVGMYVSKNPVTNKQYLLFLGGKGKGTTRPLSWPGGNFPDADADAPVVGIRRKNATKYAKAFAGRLPTLLEIQRFAPFVDRDKDSINRADKRERFDFGFFIIIPVRN